MGMLMSCFPTVLIRPWAIESQRTMPPERLDWSAGLRTKDVDEDGGDFGVVGDEFEGFFDGLGSCPSTTVCISKSIQV
jgi:hypothetical protein